MIEGLIILTVLSQGLIALCIPLFWAWYLAKPTIPLPAGDQVNASPSLDPLVLNMVNEYRQDTE